MPLLRSASAFLSAAALARASTHVSRQESRNISWSECEFKHAWTQNKPLECSFLTVPLDYTNENNGATLDMNLIRVPATNEPVLGSMLYNPGGPGEGGIEGLIGQALFLQAITQGQYHLISFDPRGTGRNKPFQCADTTTASVDKRQELEPASLPTSNLTALLEAKWPEYLHQAEICKAAHEDDGAFYGTVAVARDMARILDNLGEDGMMRYYGISYGTLLGWTFAATFPERVERMILDGNINPQEYWAGYDVESSISIDPGFRGFLDACVANPDRCELAAEGDADTILSKLRTAFESAAEGKGPTHLTLLKKAVLMKLYGAKEYPALAKLLAGLVKDGEKGLEAAMAAEEAESGKLGKGDESTEVWWEKVDDKAKQGINCGDWPLRASDPSEVAWLLEQQMPVGSWADAIGVDYWDCLVWPFDAAERYEGDFQIKTKNPVFLANPTYDPVTPLVSAKNSSSTLAGSVFLEHKGYGKCTLGSYLESSQLHSINTQVAMFQLSRFTQEADPIPSFLLYPPYHATRLTTPGHGTPAQMSSCSIKAMRAYMLEGTLPEEGAVCEPDQELFSEGFNNLAVLKPFCDEAKVVDSALDEGAAASPTSSGEIPAETTASGSSASTFSRSTVAIGAVLLAISFLTL